MATQRKAPPVPETLLVELLTEELPPKALRALGEAFAKALYGNLKQRDLLVQDSSVQVFATPRRLGARISNVLAQGPDKRVEMAGPNLKVALDAEGKPTQALLGFARKQGVEVSQLERQETPKGEVFVYRTLAKGGYLNTGLDLDVQDAVEKLPIPKVMRWADGEAEFVRPVHGLVMMHGNRVVHGNVLGISAGNVTVGHRFMGSAKIRLSKADEYESVLRKKGCVIADFVARKSDIDKQLQAQAKRQKATLGDYQELLDEVTALVEFPSVYVCGFDASFLEVPQECLILTMRQNQKYFPLFARDGKLLPRFLVVSNMKVKDPSAIVGGNERVVRPRLEDARFFFNQDRKVRLEARVPQLASVVYHNKLGSQRERVERIKLLAGEIARSLRADVLKAERAADLCKADLLTGMVGEFPELQGTMGRYYALHDGEPVEVADSIEQHYRPRFAGDALPSEPVACAVALADKLDTLVGIFGIDLAPTGDKDPFGLRRLALGVVRILCEHRLPLDHLALLRSAHGNYSKGRLMESHKRDGLAVPNPVEVAAFVVDRARSYLRDDGYSVLEVEAVLDLAPIPAEYKDRLEAVRGFQNLPQAAALAESDKRIRNILSKSGGAGLMQLTDVPALSEKAEKELLGATRLLRQKVDALVKQAKFKDALMSTAEIHAPVTRFFDEVLVNDPDEKVRRNRFALLHEVIGLTNQVANISKLAA